MKKRFLPGSLLIMAVTLGMAGLAGAQSDVRYLERDFRTLPMEARRLTGPLFWLHGDESREQLEGVLQKVLEGGNGTFTAESRPHNDWLGAGWYRDLDICLQFAKKNGMTMWIFDEKWWPSGEVGGRVPQNYGSKLLIGKANHVKGPARIEVTVFDERMVAVIAGLIKFDGVDGKSLIDLTDQVRGGKLVWEAPPGNWKVMVFSWEYAAKRRGNFLVDGASREAVDWYLDTVYKPHYDHFKDDFGKTIQGFFYDEPETLGDWGTEVIPMLKSRDVDWKKALVAWKFRLSGEEQTAAYYQYQDAKAEAWGKTLYGGISEWCRARRVISIGHFLEHNHQYLWQRFCAGNMFQLMKYTDMGGIDLVFKQLPLGKRPMGIYQMAKLGSSISHVYGKRDDLTMVEIFGARGQDLTYPEMKWQIDHMQVRGVNFIIPHSFNPRAPFDNDCPPYFYNGGREPRYPLYRVFADYTSRLSLMLTGGRHVAPVALLYLGNSIHAGKAVPPEFMTTALQDVLFDCDWMPYDVFEQDTRLEGGQIKLYGESYQVLVVPPVQVIPYGALEKAKEFLEAGGVVVGYGFLPSQSATLGKTSADIAAIREAIWGPAARRDLKVKKISPAGGRSYYLPMKPTPEEIQAVLTKDAGIHPTLEVVEGKSDHWLHVLHRVKSGRDVFFIANQNLAGPARHFTFRVTAPGEPECWDAMRNEITMPSYRRLGDGQVEISLDLEPDESLLLVFNAEQRPLPLRLSPGAQPLRTIPIISDTVSEKPKRISWTSGIAEYYRALLNKKEMLTTSPVKADPFIGNFELGADLDLQSCRFYLVCDEIKPEAAARVTMNGAYAGGFIEKPLRLDVTPNLVKGNNTILIEPFAPKSVWLEVHEK